MRKLLGLLPLFAVVACSASSSAPEVGASADDLVANGVCATLDYGPRPALNEMYQFFGSTAEASTYSQSLIDSGVIPSQLGAGSTLKGVDSDAQLVRLVGEVFAGYKKAFPLETAGLDAPPGVVLVDSTVLNAFALGPITQADGTVTPSPWLFFVSTQVLANGNTENEIRGLFAHEMGHLILRTFIPTVQARVRHSYLLDDGMHEDGVLGEAQADDPTIAGPIGTILADQTRVGSLAELGFDVAKPGMYFRLLAGLLGTVSAPTPESTAACATVNADASTLLQKEIAQVPFNLQQNLTPSVPTAAEQADLDALSTKVTGDIQACVAPGSAVASLYVVSALSQGLPLNPAAGSETDLQIKAGMLAIETQLDAEMPDAPIADRLLRAEAVLRAEVRSIRRDPSIPFPRVRVYDFEEDADDASVRVLAALGQDPTGVGGFVLSALAPADRAACLADVTAGHPVPFGGFYDVHPAPCWRYYHATQFAKSLATCSASTTPATTKRAPLITHLPANASVAPERVVGLHR